MKNQLNNKIYTTFKKGLFGANRESYKKAFLDMFGYTPKKVREHLESKFKPGMSWNNYGEWVIDHIIPISFFNFENTSDSEFFICWGMYNLQPLWASENNKKGPRRSVNDIWPTTSMKAYSNQEELIKQWKDGASYTELMFQYKTGQHTIKQLIIKSIGQREYNRIKHERLREGQKRRLIREGKIEQ